MAHINLSPTCRTHASIMFTPRVLKVSAPLLGAAAVGAVIYAARSQDEITPKLAADQPPKTKSSKDPRRIFASGISFQDMKVQSVERVNHDTKRLRFALPEEDAVTGLQPCCECDQSRALFSIDEYQPPYSQRPIQMMLGYLC